MEHSSSSYPPPQPARRASWARGIFHAVYFSMAALAALIGTAQGHVWTGTSVGMFVAIYRVRVILLLRQVPRAADLTAVGNLAAAATFIVAALTDSLALLAFAGLSAFKAWADRRRLHSTNPIERLHKEIKRRTNVVGIFPNRAALLRLAGMLLAEQDDEWGVADRRYFSLESMNRIGEPEGGDVAGELVASIA